MNQIFCWLYWNPNRELVNLPLIDHPVTWYGVFFAIGFALCYLLLVSILKKQLLTCGWIKASKIKDGEKFREDCRQNVLYPPTAEGLNQALRDPAFCSSSEEGVLKWEDICPHSLYKAKDTALFLVDRLLWYIIIGTLIGARLGEVVFYDFPIFWHNPAEIFMVWHGGLASHGAAIGIIAALYLFYRRKKDWLPGRTFVDFLDLFVIPAPVAFACIRLGNFVNQEILGTPSEAPWAIIFGNPLGGLAIVPRHPVMLYEALAYIILFAALYTFWKVKGPSLKTGFLSGIFFILAFSARFFLEFFKVAQSDTVLIPGLDMGQVLSIPFIFVGLALLWYSANKKPSVAALDF